MAFYSFLPENDSRVESDSEESDEETEVSKKNSLFFKNIPPPKNGQQRDENLIIREIEREAIHPGKSIVIGM